MPVEHAGATPDAVAVGAITTDTCVGTTDSSVESGTDSTSKYTSDEQIYNIVSYIIQNFSSFKQYSPVTERMTVEALNATLPHFPVHPSVIKAFRENGIN